MRTMNRMASIAKGLMLAAVMTVGAQNVNAQETTTYEPTSADKWWIGEKVDDVEEFYLYNLGAKIFATNNEPSVKDIENAELWTVSSDNKFTNSTTQDVIHMDGTYYFFAWSWSTAIQQNNATSFTLQTATSTTDNREAYRLAYTAGTRVTQTRYFNVDGSKYTAAVSTGDLNLWLFISTTQKAAYTDYTSLFNKLSGYLTNEKVAADQKMTADIESTLTDRSGANSSYTTYKDDKTALQTKIAEVETFINKTPTGIDAVANTTNAKQAAIYNANGVRISKMQKGINIVKMSNGETKKVIVK